MDALWTHFSTETMIQNFHIGVNITLKAHIVLQTACFST